MEWLIAIVVAAGELIIGYITSEIQQQSAESRNARETYIRSLYQAIKDKFGVTREQLEQLSNNVDIRLAQLAETSTGSARISRASQMFRKYSQEYPGLRNRINNAKTIINKATANLESKEAAAAQKIQSRGSVSASDVLRDTSPEINEINTTLKDLNENTARTSGLNEIDTSLVNPEEQKQTQTTPESEEEDRDNNSMTAW